VLLPLGEQGQYVLALVLFAIAAVGFAGNSMFSDALITDVANPSNYDRVSALGFGLGYVGSGGLFVFCVLLASSPQAFGLADSMSGVNLGFLLTGGWWLLFTIPALLWVQETPARANVGPGSVITRGFRQLFRTFADIRQDRRLLLFLGAYFLYIDGVNTVIKMATDYGLAIGLDADALIQALLVTQFIAFPSAIAFGRLAEKIGAKQSIMIGLAVYALICVYATRMTTDREFFILAGTVGMVQGGVQAISRSFFARIIPAEKGGEYFGFYNMVGRFATILGPMLMGVTALLIDSRTSILSLLLLFGGGMWLLSKVRA
jgi:MFS transporter, UMF1 family